MTRFTFTLDAQITDAAELYKAAAARYRADMLPAIADESDIVQMLGEASEPDISACIVVLLDLGSMPGCDVENSSVEEY